MCVVYVFMCVHVCVSLVCICLHVCTCVSLCVLCVLYAHVYVFAEVSSVLSTSVQATCSVCLC